MGWFDGFTLHRMVNDRSELLAFRLTPGNVDDRQPVALLTDGLTGKRIAGRSPSAASRRFGSGGCT